MLRKNFLVRARYGATAALLMAGCAARNPLMPKPDLVPKQAPAQFDDKDWSTVLLENVRDDRVDYDHLARQRDALDRFIALISVVGPSSTPGLFPDKPSQAAYWINAYNAEMLNVVLSVHPVKSLYELTRPDPEAGFILTVDKRPWTLGQIRHLLLEESGGDVRVHFALCGAAIGEPPLRNQPFRGVSLDRDLAISAARAMSNPRMVTIVHDEKQLRLWLRIMSEKDAFIKYHERRLRSRAPSLLSVLLDFAEDKQRATLNTAVGYKLSTIPFDRRLNQWQPGS